MCIRDRRRVHGDFKWLGLGIKASITQDNILNIGMAAEAILKGIVPDTGKFVRDFMNIKKIAGKGFVSVYIAKNKVDQQEYAIKKTILKVSSHDTQQLNTELNKMLREVRLFASIRDPHIIRYYNSWIELKDYHEELASISSTEENITMFIQMELYKDCLLYTSPSPRDLSTSRMPSSA
eukprot:TRINITY_DN9834_c0_g1_i1.p1 TRINITY_DN9834_c0_g1~~TRINITY_DN9834_c0_g1_i1.p1  ORF type:complete len:179 (-),score=52.08 TRINITY_DN9834_c0_g1_i1:12-548(-)